MYIYFQRFVSKSNITNSILIHWYIFNVAYTKLLENIEKDVKRKLKISVSTQCIKKNIKQYINFKDNMHE